MVPKRLLILVSMLVALCSFAFAQGVSGGGPGSGSGGAGAADDSDWTFPDGSTAHLDVTENPNGGVWTTSTTAGGFSSAVDGSQGADTPSGATTCRNSKTMTNASGDQTKVIDGKLNKKGADGKWKRGRNTPKPKKTKTTRSSGSGSMRFSAGLPTITVGALPWDHELVV